jgi:hypothetical protein
MIIETVTVTTTETSLKDLINEARVNGEARNDVANSKCSMIRLRCVPDAAVAVKMSEANTVTPVAVLDAPNGIFTAAFNHFDFDQVSLKVAADTLDVEVIIEQGRV